MSLSPRRLLLPLLTAASTATPTWAAPPVGFALQGASVAPVQAIPVSSAPAPQSGGALILRIRRSPGTIELVVEGTGPAPILQQAQAGGSWQGLLRTGALTGLRLGPQRISMPEAGLQAVSFTGGGTDYQLDVTPVPGLPLGRPVVSADGRNLLISFPVPPTVAQQTARLDLRQPGSVPQPSFAPPLQPRAVAPPLGDMAVGSMVLRNRSFINISGPPVTMTLRNAPARDALMALAQMGGYGFVYVDDGPAAGATPAASAGGGSVQGRPVSIAFQRETYARAVNAVLLAAGLQGRVEGNMILAGPSVMGKTFGAQVSKVYRLNQASAASAADYLASLGATITKVSVITNATTSGQALGNQVAGGAQASTTQTQSVTTTETYGAAIGPLRGLSGTTDSRLQTITLVGDPQVVAVAENYLRQIDLRQRQVALSVKILDISLGNEAVIENSFAFRYGNNFIVNNNGQLLAAFGRYQPPSDDVFGDGSTETLNSGSQSSSSATSNSGRESDSNQGSESTRNSGSNQTTNVTQDGTTFDFETTNDSNRDSRSTRNDRSTRDRQSDRQSGTNSSSQRAGQRRFNPGMLYPKDNFFDFVQSVITSSSTKVLASPTLILSENQEEIAGGAAVVAAASQDTGTEFQATIGRPRANESFVTVGEQVVTNYTQPEVSEASGTATGCEATFGISGLTFGARVSKIDDNGFVTFTMSPQIAATTRTQRIEGCGDINILAIRRLDTGSARVRDGQTLILTGVISDSDRQVVSKWPILGDLPFIGQFFRGSAGNREKRELVIMVTPRIIDDTEGGSYGYGYQPSTREARQFFSGQNQPPSGY